MSKAVVALIPVESYDPQLVTAAVQHGINLLGGVSAFIKPEEQVLLKPNLLAKALPQRAITTHPVVVQAVIRVLQSAGIRHLSYGDSPGSPGLTVQRCAEGCGVAQQAEKLGVPVADFDHGSVVKYPQGERVHSFYLCNAVQQTDCLVNLCKMKTHALERITGAVKNIYGCVTGLNKSAGHVTYPDSSVFAEMLVDLNKCVKPRLHIMDGITAMQGNGPTSGTPVDMKVMLFSDDPVALDAVFAALVHLDPRLVPTCRIGQAHGLGVADLNRIAVLTPDGTITPAEAAARYGKADFDVFRGQLKKGLITKLVPLLPFLQERPKVDAAKCIACGICQEACPVPQKAVHSGKGQKAVYDYRKCIRCYCCQEMCPARAIDVHRPKLARLLNKK